MHRWATAQHSLYNRPLDRVGSLHAALVMALASNKQSLWKPPTEWNCTGSSCMMVKLVSAALPLTANSLDACTHHRQHRHGGVDGALLLDVSLHSVCRLWTASTHTKARHPP